jgi:hypothetical protein
MQLCVVISSLGRTERLGDLLESLCAQTESNFEVCVCDQSPDGSVRKVLGDYSERLNFLVTSSARGLSRGRNAGIGLASEVSTHFVFPNDTTLLPANFVEDLYRNHSGIDVLAVSYMEEGVPRNSFLKSTDSLDCESVWLISEAAMVVSKRAVEWAGGFDEDLGTGASTPWQSGEGTDLLLKLRDKSPVVHWDPSLHVMGVSQDYALSAAERRTKLRSYGRGYGYVLSRWRYSWRRRLMALAGPFIKPLTTGKWMDFCDSVYSCIGRVEGVLGGSIFKSRTR